MKRRPTNLAHLQPLHPHTEVSPSSSHTLERTAGPYSPSIYSRADNYSEYHYRPYADAEEDPLPTVPDHLRENVTSSYTRDDSGAFRVSSASLNDEDLTNGLSLMGPRMKMLSRAPWEVSSPLIEGDEDPSVDDSADSVSMFGRRSRSKTLTKATESLKGFRRGGSKSHDITVPSANTRTSNSPSNGVGDTTSIISSDPDPFGTGPTRPTWRSLPRARTPSSSASTSHTDSVISSTAPSSSSSNVPPVYSPFSERFPGSQSPSPSLKSFEGSGGAKRNCDRPPSPADIYETAALSSVHPYASPDLCFLEGNLDTTPQPSSSQDQSHLLDTSPFSRFGANYSTSTISGEAPKPALTFPSFGTPSSPPSLQTKGMSKRA